MIDTFSRKNCFTKLFHGKLYLPEVYFLSYPMISILTFIQRTSGTRVIEIKKLIIKNQILVTVWAPCTVYLQKHSSFFLVTAGFLILMARITF